MPQSMASCPDQRPANSLVPALAAVLVALRRQVMSAAEVPPLLALSLGSADSHDVDPVDLFRLMLRPDSMPRTSDWT